MIPRHHSWGFWKEALLDFFFPSRCAVCGGRLGHSGQAFCSACLEGFSLIGHPRCPGCGKPFKSPAQKDHPCQDCLQERWEFDGAFSVFYYRDTLRQAVHLFKYARRTILSAPLANFLCREASPWVQAARPELMVPVPSRASQLKQRGFNPPLFLARHLHSKWSLPLRPEALECVKDIASQAGLGRRERLANVRGAFRALPSRVKGRSVLLVDDVLTTGATAQECARALKRAGARAVWVLTLARTVEWDLRPSRSGTREKAGS